MTYYQFIQAVESRMKEVVKEELSLSIYTTEKNNGVIRQGITISKKGINISPTIYLEEYYEQYLDGNSLDNIVEDIVYLYHHVQLNKSWDEDQITCFDSIKDKIVYRLINRESNESLLEGVPYVPYLNLAIVFYVMLEMNNNGMACMLIRKEHLEMWQVTESQIYNYAKENTWHLLPCEFHTMEAVMKEYNKKGSYIGMEILHVLTNKIRNFGATVILYEGCLDMIGDYLGDNYFVLPSSVHEMIIVAEKEAPWGGAGLSQMVREINRTQVEAEDVLSDIVYYYDREKKKLL